MLPHLEGQYALLFPALSTANPALFPAAVFTLESWLWVGRRSLCLPLLFAIASPCESCICSSSICSSMCSSSSRAKAGAAGTCTAACDTAVSGDWRLPLTSAANVDDDGVLVPVLDFFNHDHFSCHVDFVRKGGKGDSPPGISAVVRPGSSVERGEEDLFLIRIALSPILPSCSRTGLYSATTCMTCATSISLYSLAFRMSPKGAARGQ